MRYVPGGSLADRLRSDPAEQAGAADQRRVRRQPDSARFVRTVAQAVQYAHDRLVLHRDLKPGNILLDEHGQPLVSDFGLARRVGAEVSQTVSGTPCYMPPEQAHPGPETLAVTADVYSLGAILYELLTGRPPFQGRNAMQTLLQVVSAEPVRPRRLNPRLSPDLEAVCLKCLEKEPARRYPSAAALADDLARYLDSRPTLARPGGRLVRLGKSMRRRPLAWMLSAATALFVVLFGVVSLFLVFSNIDAASARASANEADARRLQQELDAEREKAERLQKERHAERIRAGDVAARLGDWREALSSYEQAIRDDLPDHRHLEVVRLRGLFQYASTVETEKELQRLWGLRDKLDADDRARLLLARGEYLICDNSTLGEALKLLRQALDTGKLSAADTAYVRGLLTDRLTEAIGHFRKAVELERAHLGANHSLLLALVICGRFAEARTQATAVRSVFSRDPIPSIAEAFIFLAEGDYPACCASIDRIRPLIGDQRHKDYRAHLERLHKLLEAMFRAERGEPTGGLTSFLQDFLAVQWNGLQRTTPFSFNVPVSKWLGLRLLKIQDIPWSTAVVVAAGKARTAPPEWFLKNSLAGLEKICDDSPEPVFLQVLGIVRMSKALFQIQKGDRAGGALQLRQAALTMYDGAEAPTLVPQSCTRYLCRAFGMMMDQAMVTEFGAEKDAAIQNEVRDARERMRAQVGRVMQEGRQFPVARASILNPKTPDAFDGTVFTLLLLDWEAHEVGNPTPGTVRVQHLLRAKNFGAAFDEAGNLLQRFPNNPTLTRLRQDAQKKITDQFLKAPAAGTATP
jgi:tetratricopeptide (TPR) repeat protein